MWSECFGGAAIFGNISIILNEEVAGYSFLRSQAVTIFLSYF